MYYPTIAYTFILFMIAWSYGNALPVVEGNDNGDINENPYPWENSVHDIPFAKSIRRKRSSAINCHPTRRAPIKDVSIVNRRAFFKTVYNRQAELVILVERSERVGRNAFNYYVRPALKQFLRHYTIIGRNHVKLAIISFAKDLKVHLDGFTHDKNKCDIFRGKPSILDEIVLSDTSNDTWTEGNFNNAYKEAAGLFRNSNGLLNDSPKYILMIAAGYYDTTYDNPDFRDVRDELVKDMGVTILGVLSKAWTNDGLAGISWLVGGDEFVIGTDCQFVEGLYQDHQEPVTQMPPELVSSAPGSFTNFKTCYCDIVSGYEFCDLVDCNDCQSPSTGGRTTDSSQPIPFIVDPACRQVTCDLSCVIRTGFSVEKLLLCGPPLFKSTCSDYQYPYDHYSRKSNERICRCRWDASYTGADCKEETDPCVPEACANGGTCLKGDPKYSQYECDCLPPYTNAYFCEYTGQQTTTPREDDETMVAAAAGGGAGLFIICCFIIGCCVYKKRRKPVVTTDMATYTSSPQVQPAIEHRPRRNNLVNTLRRVSQGVTRLPLLTGRAWPSNKPLPIPPKPPIKPPRIKMSPLDGVYSEVESNLPPDVINRLGGQTDISHGDNDDDGEMYHENELIVQGLDDWRGYMAEMLSSPEISLTDLCVVDKNRRTYISSSFRFLPTKKELKSYLKIMRSYTSPSSIMLKHQSFSVVANDGTTIQTTAIGEHSGTMCISKSKLYVIIGYTPRSNSDETCLSETTFVRDYLLQKDL